MTPEETRRRKQAQLAYERERKATNDLAMREFDRERAIEAIHKEHIETIQEQIDGFYMRYAGSEGLTRSEAMKRADQMDVTKFANKAKKAVKEKDFSPETNDWLKTYNLKMKVSRLELLKEELNWELIKMYDKDYQLISESLREEARLELERQAGILGDSAKGASKRIGGIVDSDFYGKNFSERIWDRTGMYQSTQKEVFKSLSRIYTTMDGYRNERNRLMDKMQTTEYETMRLLRTENARIGSQMQVEAYKENKFTHFIYVAEPSACDVCKPLDGKMFKVEDAQIGLNLKPIHPNCYCSSYGYIAMERLVDRERADVDDGIIKMGIIEKEYPKRHVEKIKEALSEAPTNVKRAWNKVADNFQITDSKKKGAFFNPGDANGKGRGVKLNINSVAKGSDYQKPFQVVFHEYGHHIDFELNKLYGNGNYREAISQTYKNGLLGEKVKEEGRKVVAEYAEKHYDRIASEGLPGVWSKRYEKLKGNYSGWADIEEKLNDRDFVGPERLMLDMIRNQVHTTWQDEMKESLTPFQRADISDMFEGSSINSHPLGYGHGKAYHNKKGTAKEAFAEMYSATASNPESLEQIKKYFPESYKIFEEILGVIE